MFWTKNSHNANKLYLLKALGLNLSLLCYVAQNLIIHLYLHHWLSRFSLLSRRFILWQYTKEELLKENFKCLFFIIFNVFGFDAIMKMDLLILSIFAGPKVLSVYALYSAVVEGYVQILASFKYKSSLAIVKRIIGDNIIKSGFVLSLSFIPALLIFLLLSVKETSLCSKA